MQKVQKVNCNDQFIEYFKKMGLKITPQRCAVYRELIQAKSHPTAEEMFQTVRREFPNISYDTVNRTLLKFAEIGLVDTVKSGGGPRRFDPVMDNHHHFHCVKCGNITDFRSEEYSSLGIPDEIQDGCIVFTKRIVLNGICKECRKKGKA